MFVGDGQGHHGQSAGQCLKGGVHPGMGDHQGGPFEQGKLGAVTQHLRVGGDAFRSRAGGASEREHHLGRQVVAGVQDGLIEVMEPVLQGAQRGVDQWAPVEPIPVESVPTCGGRLMPGTGMMEMVRGMPPGEIEARGQLRDLHQAGRNFIEVASDVPADACGFLVSSYGAEEGLRRREQQGLHHPVAEL